MRTLYVTDLDGTLMRNDMTISDESVRILNRLIDLRPDNICNGQVVSKCI